MIRVAVVEDDFASRSLLEEYLRRCSEDFSEPFEVSVFEDGDGIVRRGPGNFDIILLDVQMERLDGFAAAKLVRAEDEDVIIIFITNMGQYAIRGYEVDALSFLLKPVPYAAFCREIRRSLQRMQKRQARYFTLPNEHGFIRIPLADILFVERDAHRVLFHTESRTYSMTGTIREASAKLEPLHFFRCNSGYIVNMARVTGVEDGFVIVGKNRLQISRPKKRAFMQALTDYFGGSGT